MQLLIVLKNMYLIQDEETIPEHFNPNDWVAVNPDISDRTPIWGVIRAGLRGKVRVVGHGLFKIIASTDIDLIKSGVPPLTVHRYATDL